VKDITIRIPTRWLRRIALGAVAVIVLVPTAVIAAGGTFVDDDTSPFEADIEWLADAEVTRGCNSAAGLYCPNDAVTRGQMAAFMHRFADYLGAIDGTPANADNATKLDGSDADDYRVNLLATDEVGLAHTGGVLGGHTGCEIPYTPGQSEVALLDGSFTITTDDAGDEILMAIEVEANGVAVTSTSIGDTIGGPGIGVGARATAQASRAVPLTSGTDYTFYVETIDNVQTGTGTCALSVTLHPAIDGISLSGSTLLLPEGEVMSGATADQAMEHFNR